MVTARGGQLDHESTRHTITGEVSEAVSGKPISNVRVDFSGIKRTSVYTKPDGRFEIQDVREGQVHLTPVKPGFFDSYSTNYPKHEPTFTVGASDNDFQLILFPAATITGQLTTQDGMPIKNTIVEIAQLNILNGYKTWLNQLPQHYTDDDGSYRVDNLRPGLYLVFAAGYPLEPSDSKAPPHVISPAFFGDTKNIASATAIELRPGQEYRADIHLREELVIAYPLISLAFRPECSSRQRSRIRAVSTCWRELVSIAKLGTLLPMLCQVAFGGLSSQPRAALSRTTRRGKK
jgi:hypothetical protein